MSDSLREQMLKAGFKETAAPRKKSKLPNNSKPAKRASQHSVGHSGSKNAAGPSTMERENIAKREAIAERKRIKAEIKTIIEAEKIDNTTGESSHSYVVGKRIKQMFVSDAIREKLVDGSLVITRLNGATYLVPAQTGEKVQALNPEWVVITPSSDNQSDDDEDYADYQVPDDLKW